MDHSNRNSVEDDMRVVPVEGGLGARIEGIDLSLPLTEKDRDIIRQTLGRRGMVRFPGQKINDNNLKRFAGMFGTLEVNLDGSFQEPSLPWVWPFTTLLVASTPI